MHLEDLPIINNKRVLNDDYVNERFEKIINEMASENPNADLSFILEGFCGEDLSEVDMSGLSLENFRRLTFDSKTQFPDAQTATFAKKLIEQGKSFSNAESLHEEGINGEGTTIAILDRCFDSSIPEFNGRVVQYKVFEKVNGEVICRDYINKDSDGFHGKTVASMVAGNECGVAPKASMYLFGIGESVTWAEAEEAMLKYIENENIKPDVVSMSADIKTSEESEKRLNELKKDGCAILDSSSFWKDFSWGRISDDGKTVSLDGLMELISKMPCDENSRVGKIKKNIPNTAVIPCTGRTSVQVGEETVYKYNGSLCGASFAIPQIAGVFLLARQIDSSVRYDEFIGILKNSERLNSEGMMYVDAKEIVNEVRERRKTNILESAVQATEEETRTGEINEQAQTIKSIERAKVQTQQEI